MPELREYGALPDLDAVQNNEGTFETENEDAPYGYKADGTPRRKPGRPKGSTNSGASGSRSVKLESRIALELSDLSALLMFSPMAMLHMERRADKTASALVQLANRYPRIKDAINTYLNSAAYKDIVLFVGGIPVAIAIDFGRLKPNAIIGRPFGMQNIWEECYGDEGSERNPEWNAEPRGLAAEL